MSGSASLPGPKQSRYHQPGSLEMLNQSQSYDANTDTVDKILSSLFAPNFGFSPATLPEMRSPRSFRKQLTHLTGSVRSRSNSLDSSSPHYHVVTIKTDGVALERRFGDRGNPDHYRDICESMKNYFQYLNKKSLIPVTTARWVAAWELLKTSNKTADISNYTHLPLTGFSQCHLENFPLLNQNLERLATTFETCFFSTIQHSLELKHTPESSSSSTNLSQRSSPDAADMRRVKEAAGKLCSTAVDEQDASYKEDLSDLEKSLGALFSSSTVASSAQSSPPKEQVDESSSKAFPVELLSDVLSRIFRPTPELLPLYQELTNLIASQLGKEPTWADFLKTLHKSYTNTFHCIPFVDYRINFAQIRTLVMPTLGHFDAPSVPRHLLAHQLLKIYPSTLIKLHQYLHSLPTAVPVAAAAAAAAAAY